MIKGGKPECLVMWEKNSSLVSSAHWELEQVGRPADFPDISSVAAAHPAEREKGWARARTAKAGSLGLSGRAGRATSIRVLSASRATAWEERGCTASL